MKTKTQSQTQTAPQPFKYRRKDKEPTLLQDMSLEELHEELSLTRARKKNIEFVEKKLEAEVLKRLKNEPAPKQVLVLADKRIVK